MAAVRNRNKDKKRKSLFDPQAGSRPPVQPPLPQEASVAAQVSIATDHELHLLDEPVLADELELHDGEPPVVADVASALPRSNDFNAELAAWLEETPDVSVLEPMRDQDFDAELAVWREELPAADSEYLVSSLTVPSLYHPGDSPEDALEAILAQSADAAPESGAESGAEPLQVVETDAAPEPGPESGPESGAESGAELEAEPVSVAETQATPEPGPESGAGSGAESGPESGAELEAARPAVEAEAAPEPGDSQPQPVPASPRHGRPPEVLLEAAGSDDTVRAPALDHLNALREAHARGDLAATLAAFHRGVQAFPEEGGLYGYLGMALLGWGVLPEARAVLAGGLERDPSCRLLFEVLAELELRLGRRDSARRLLVSALERFEPDVGLLRRSARQAVRMGELRWAQELLEQAIGLGGRSEALDEIEREIQFRRSSLQHAARAELKRVLASQIRAPLEVISGYLVLVEQEPDLERRKKYAARISQQIEALQALASDARSEVLEEA